MNMLDCVIEPGDQIHTEMTHDQGPIAADDYMRAYNNACVQYAGFETYFQAQISGGVRPHIAWINNLSTTEH